jgi:hypothetical protein
MNAPALTCIEYRNLVGGEPGRRDAAIAAHRLACRGCAGFSREVEALDLRLAQALAVPMPEGLAHRVVLRATADQAPPTARWALAAAAAFAFVVAGAVWFAPRLQPTATPVMLAAEVLAHARHEPASWSAALQPVASTSLRNVLARGEVELLDEARLGVVTYAMVCPLRGHQVPHLMVQSVAGPAMVLLLPDEPLVREQRLDEEGLHGVLVPVGKGSIAIVAADPRAIEAVRQRVTRAVDLGI